MVFNSQFSDFSAPYFDIFVFLQYDNCGFHFSFCLLIFTTKWSCLPPICVWVLRISNELTIVCYLQNIFKLYCAKKDENTYLLFYTSIIQLDAALILHGESKLRKLLKSYKFHFCSPLSEVFVWERTGNLLIVWHRFFQELEAEKDKLHLVRG